MSHYGILFLKKRIKKLLMFINIKSNYTTIQKCIDQIINIINLNGSFHKRKNTIIQLLRYSSFYDLKKYYKITYNYLFISLLIILSILFYKTKKYQFLLEIDILYVKFKHKSLNLFHYGGPSRI